MPEDVKPIKKIYFVRHGETDANINGIVQSPDQELNVNGLMQAEKVAARVSGLDISIMVASDFKRAAQTAAVIANRNKLVCTASELFREVATPTSLRGVARVSPEYQAYSDAWQANFTSSDWHFENEENIEDVLKRCRLAKKYLENLEEQNILVVTHGLFLHYLVAYLIFEEGLTPAERVRFNKKLFVSNTGLTVFTIKEGTDWQLLTWNDYAHLAD